MSLLLDTQVLIALIENRLDNLPLPVNKAVTLAGATVFASVASLWEIAIKVRLGKLPLKASLSALPRFVDDAGLGLLTITAPHVLAELTPQPSTRDPFDRLL